MKISLALISFAVDLQVVVGAGGGQIFPNISVDQSSRSCSQDLKKKSLELRPRSTHKKSICHPRLVSGTVVVTVVLHTSHDGCKTLEVPCRLRRVGDLCWVSLLRSPTT